MISKLEYEAIKQQHEIACKQNDYSKMVMVGDSNYKKMKEYEAEFVCEHSRIIEEQGGQIERCANCGKTWG